MHRIYITRSGKLLKYKIFYYKIIDAPLVLNDDVLFSALIQSLQLPLGSLMREIATTMNSSEINLFDLSETVGSAVENTMQTVRQVSH